MKTRIFSMTAGLATLAISIPATAADVNFVPPTNFNWHDPNMWTPTGVPVDGDVCDLEEGNIDFVIDIHNAASPGSGVNLPNSTIITGRGSYIDSDGADDGINCAILQANGAGGRVSTINVPVTTPSVTTNRHGAIFNAATTLVDVVYGGSHQIKGEWNVSPTAPLNLLEIAATDGRGGTDFDDDVKINADLTTTDFTQVWGGLTVDNGVTFTVTGTYEKAVTNPNNGSAYSNHSRLMLDGDMVAGSMTFDGVDQGTGTWGSTASATPATNKVDWIIGDGILTVGSDDYTTWAENFPGADLSDPAADNDGDGLSNNEERLFGLDPTDPASQNPITVALDPAAGSFSFTRRDDALTGKFTTIETSTDLVTWTEDAGAVLTPGAPDGDDIETVAATLSPSLLSAPTLFARVVQGDGILLSENFESDDGGFTVVDNSAGETGSDWSHGTPDSDGGEGGGAVTEGNGGSTNCWGTDISNPGTYATGTDTSLISPVIDLTNVANATLAFAESLDVLTDDTLVVNVIDDDISGGVSVLQPAIHTSTPDPDSGSTAWAPANGGSPIAITGGQPVRIEWRFSGDGDGTYIGAYVDDISVGKTLP